MARHYYIAEPFPDELIGSVLIRTARHRGLGIKDLSTLLGSSKQSKFTLLLTQHLECMAKVTRASPLELLHSHTPFRYITAFMSPQETDRFAKSILEGTQGSLASLVHSVTTGGRRPRYCPQCVADDRANRGDSYWHRKHNLPFVDACHIHKIPLFEIQSRGSFAASGLPEEYSGIPVEQTADSAAFTWLAKQSIGTLETRFRRPVEEWFGVYREIAIQRGFPRESTGLCGKSLCKGLLELYGQPFFRKMNWLYSMEGKSWAALMFRDSHTTALVTGKHLVIQAFLKFSPVPAKVQTGKPGRKDRDYGHADQQFYRMLQRRMSQEPIPGRPAAQLLLRELEIWETYKHHKRQLPTTNALVAEWYNSFVKLKKEGKLPKKVELRKQLSIRLQQSFPV